MYNKLLNKEADGFIVTKFDRISRDMYYFLNFARTMFDKNIMFISCTQPIDTSSFLDKVFLKIICLFAEFEREMIAERTRASYKARRDADLLVTCAKIGQEIKVTDKGKEVIYCLDNFRKVK
jgi:DNA invertase Pin-like site-specific DNA recombinase